MGLVSEVFNERTHDASSSLQGTIGIGHTRYSTAGTKTLENSGPFVVSGSSGHIGVSHNGEITNSDVLKEEMMKIGLTFLTSSDTEVMLMEFARDITSYGLVNGIRIAMERLKGAYSVAMMVNDRLIAIRDPLGIRPLVVGTFDGNYIVASETCALDILGARKLRDVKPGEAVEITDRGVETIVSRPATRMAHCMFEYVYFARPDSVIDDVDVFQTRIRLGRKLAQEYPVEADVVIPVPDSGRAQALGYSQESGIPYNEGLIKNRFSERTFIMPTQESRKKAITLKLNAIRSVVSGKRIVLVDDSIIRGNTMNHIVNILRNAGASEVHIRVGSPPIIAPCYYGVDMKTKDQFVATGRSVEDIRVQIGADSLGYISIDGLVESITMPENTLCLGCLTASYPTHIPDSARPPRQTELENFSA